MEINYLENLARNLKTYKNKNRITARGFKEKTGIALGVISELENEKNENPNWKTLLAIKNELGIDFNTLFGDNPK